MDDAKQTCGEVARDTVPNGLATDAVLLCSEEEGPVVGLPDMVKNWSGCSIEIGIVYQ
jgi:hypothetical protein